MALAARDRERPVPRPVTPAGSGALFALTVGLLVACWLPSRFVAGSDPVPAVLYLLPVVAGSAFCGPRMALAVAAVAAIFAGPLTPQDAGHGLASAPGAWLLRGACFMLVAFTVSSLGERLERASVAVEVAQTTDPLTRLLGHSLLLKRLSAALQRAQSTHTMTAVLLLDLDDFRFVNASVGHAGGDRILSEVARRLQRCLRGGRSEHGAPSPDTFRVDTLARLCGDEFVVVLEGLREPAAAASVAARLLAVIAEPFTDSGGRVALHATIGIVVVPGDSTMTPDRLLRHADAAMYGAKELGKNRFGFFSPEMESRVADRVALIQDLRDAVRGEQFRLVYQPQVDLVTGRVTGAEALLRWEHPSRGTLSPDTFIPLAEASGTIVEIDDWVLATACRQLRSWRDRGITVSMAVNVSAGRLTAPGFVEHVQAVLAETGVPVGALEVEVTETVAVDDSREAARVLARLRALGVSAAIDDFGMGHSALSRLHSFPVDRVKIDRSFISALHPAAVEAGTIAGAMITMAHALGLEVVAEGIETEDHVAALRMLGCPTGQGYLFGRPLEVAAIESVFQTTFVPQPAPVSPQSATDEQPLVRGLLAELGRLTGLESTYLTTVDLDAELQRIAVARNVGDLDLHEGSAVPWRDALCRISLERGLPFTDDVPRDLPGSDAAAELGLQSYAGVPIRSGTGELVGTLCGASRRQVTLSPQTMAVMESFAALIAEATGGPRRAASPIAETVPQAR